MDKKKFESIFHAEDETLEETDEMVDHDKYFGREMPNSIYNQVFEGNIAYRPKETAEEIDDNQMSFLPSEEETTGENVAKQKRFEAGEHVVIARKVASLDNGNAKFETHQFQIPKGYALYHYDYKITEDVFMYGIDTFVCINTVPVVASGYEDATNHTEVYDQFGVPVLK